ncbi:polyphenol oxidase family protein [Bifidobacterium xylocopae]|uniref:Copper oxidase n=1 Tax=Bifidobacterium xylocopae TaxID=2493119 RepID=A0A366KC89_9BIFI|nr:polyphenol oxidase family protein [Bifidobacterium xylocopae]RBP99356.1 copper oxidase [Bifidobacterium xylocopae]
MEDEGTYGEWSREHELVDSSAVPHDDGAGAPIPVTIPVDLAAGVKVVFTTRLGGVSRGDYASLNLGGKGGDDPIAVGANRRALERTLGAPLTLVSQVHSGKAQDADRSPRQELASVNADALVSSQAGVALGMFAADCLPVLLADPHSGVIGAAHCGRRGLEQGVITAVVDLMVAKGARRRDIVAGLGPAICADCYEVGDRIAADFSLRFPGTAGPTRFGGQGIDISGAARQALAQTGVDRLVDCGPRMAAATQYLRSDPELADLCAVDGEGPDLAGRLKRLRHARCTLENPLWYSHRRAALAGKSHEGRMLALIVRAD